MRESPFIVATPSGPIGGMVAATDEPTARVLILAGRGQRSGPDGMWATCARQIAERGPLVIRADYPGYGDSFLARAPDGDAWLDAVLGSVALDTPGPLLVIGSCYGARLATTLAARDRSTQALMLVAPAFRAGPTTRPMRRLSNAIERRRGREPLDRDLLDAFTAAASRMPISTLVGERDLATPEGAATSAWMVKALPTHAPTVLPGVTVHGYGSTAIQSAVRDHLTSWAVTAVASGSRA